MKNSFTYLFFLVFVFQSSEGIAQAKTKQEIQINYEFKFLHFTDTLFVKADATTCLTTYKKWRVPPPDLNGAAIYQYTGLERKVALYFHAFQNYNQRTMTYKEPINKGTYIKDSLNLFDWTITKNVKTILDYAAQEAKAHYRGREYTAYFTTELPFKAAPWKFHGLPGVILEVHSEDGEIVIEPYSIVIKKQVEPIINPYLINKKITWEDFKKRHQERLNQNKALFIKMGYPEITSFSMTLIEVIE